MSEIIDNRSHRIRTLKHIIKHLHEGVAPEEVREQLLSLVKECDSTEIAQMEQELMAEGVPVEEIMGMCDLHSQVVKEILVEKPVPLLSPGHPAKTLQAENRAIERQVGLLREAFAELVKPPGKSADSRQPTSDTLSRYRGLLNELKDIENHYQRKEHLLFSMLERHGITGPSKVMWGKDDEVRDLLKSLHEVMQQDGVTCEVWSVTLPAVAEPVFEAVSEMVFKEEHILIPMALQTLTDLEWGDIWRQSPAFGWCLVDPGEGYQPPEPVIPEITDAVSEVVGQSGVALNVKLGAADGDSPTSSSIVFPTGSLTLDQLKAIFTVLPIDITYVDADDRVRFFSEGQSRVFARPKAIIGRKVQHCHPPGSVGIVETILDDFKSGRQDIADFWIELHGQFVFIRYFALRDAEGGYLGTMEVTQDLTRERKLTGERRLLEYDTEAVDSAYAEW